MQRRVLLRSLTASAAIPLTAFAQAPADWPNKPLSLVVPWPPGGSSDVAARLVGAHLSKVLNQPVVIDNRAGASGKIGSEAVARSAPDGYTLLLANSISHASITLTDRQMTYDPEKDFAPVALLTQSPLVLAVHPSLPVNTVPELIAFAKSRPGTLNFGSPGPGSAHHLLGEWFRSRAGVNMVHVPYKGVAPAQADLLAGTVQLMFDPSVTQHVGAGKLRGLATTGSARSPVLPALPTLEEAGLKGMVLIGWNGLVAPAGTPRPLLERLNRAVRGALEDKEFGQKLVAIGLIPAAPSEPEELGRQVAYDLRLYREIVQSNNLKLD